MPLELPPGFRVLDRNSVCEEKNGEFSFSTKLMSKLVCLANAVVLDSVFSFKSSNAAITNCGLNLIQLYLIFKFLQLSLSWIAAFESFIFVPIFFLLILLLELLQVQLPLSWTAAFGNLIISIAAVHNNGIIHSFGHYFGFQTNFIIFFLK